MHSRFRQVKRPRTGEPDAGEAGTGEKTSLRVLPAKQPGRLRPLVAFIVVLLLVWMLRATMTVLMPPTVAALVVILLWPLQSRLEQRLPRLLSVVTSVFIVVLALCLLGGAFWMCGNAVASHSAQFQQQFNTFVGRMDAFLSQHQTLAQFRHWNPEQIFGQAMHLLSSFAVAAYQVVGCLILIGVFLVLLLIEVQPFNDRFQQRFAGERADRITGAARDTATSIRRFVVMRTVTCTTAGVLTGVFTWAIGLDLALVWAMLAFVLNYIPVFGPIVSVIPPTLVALIEPGRPWLVFVTLGGLTVIHFLVGNYLDPMLQGRYLSLPPFVIFFSLVFWSWAWGIPGAVLSVPLTVGIVVSCQHFESTRWVARLLLNH